MCEIQREPFYSASFSAHFDGSTFSFDWIHDHKYFFSLQRM